jgi:hypothetical protein
MRCRKLHRIILLATGGAATLELIGIKGRFPLLLLSPAKKTQGKKEANKEDSYYFQLKLIFKIV